MIGLGPAVSLIIALSTVAEAGPPPKAPASKNAALTRMRDLLPKDWTIELAGLPAGVEAMAFGPVTEEGRAVVIATRLADPRVVLDRAALERKLRTKIVSYDENDAFGATEIRTNVISDGVEMSVLHVLGPPVAPYAISVIAPKTMFPSIYKLLSIAAKRLAAERLDLSEKVGIKQ